MGSKLESFWVPICNRNPGCDSFFFKSFKVGTVFAITTETVLLETKAITISGEAGVTTRGEAGGEEDRQFETTTLLAVASNGRGRMW
jgi:hypothetical protein